MTRDFVLTWAARFNELTVKVDPVGLKDWTSPLGMVQWVVGHAMYGAPKRWLETRRDDCVTLMGVAGRWEGLLYHQPFVILDTLFAARPEPKSRKRKGMGSQAIAGAGGGVYYVQANVNPDWLPAPQWMEGNDPEQAMPGQPLDE